ncbi:MAG: hypothetical protein FJW23_15465 [Acidimicrobiia bacterium]|nr:hypothetical protein [Acidimicrobiia bacterium]
MAPSAARKPSAAPTVLGVHPVAALFPDLSQEDFRALVDDIRQHGVKLPILVHRGQILDGRHRYRACRKLGVPCPTLEWNGEDPWFEVQSRNLLRRHLGKEQIYAIRKIAADRFPELARAMTAVRASAALRKAQAKGQPRGAKALAIESPSERRESADVIGEQIGVSGATVKRVDRLVRLAPALLPKVAAGQLSVSKALHMALAQQPPEEKASRAAQGTPFAVAIASRRLRSAIRSEWSRWPREHRERFLNALKLELQDLIYEATVVRSTHGDDDAPPRDSTIASIA